MRHRIATVVIPAAGRGTRLLPATKAIPKELLNVYDRPALQFAIDEAMYLGVSRIVIVTHPSKQSIRNYFSPASDIIDALRDSGKSQIAEALAKISIPDHVEIVFVEQSEQLGLGHAILCAARHVLPGTFGVILPDDLILGTSCLSEMAQVYTQGHMIAAMEVPGNKTSSYGIFRLAAPSIGQNAAVLGMVEKPAPGHAPSRLAAVGRYILDQGIFTALHRTAPGAGDEIQLTDALEREASRVPLSAFRFSGTRFDCGSHDGLLDAAIARREIVQGREANAEDTEGRAMVAATGSGT
jgi:UTP--glucose-1-phosphate uridylyltransferase